MLARDKWTLIKAVVTWKEHRGKIQGKFRWDESKYDNVLNKIRSTLGFSMVTRFDIRADETTSTTVGKKGQIED